uniref:Peptidase S1 domain-containing protein n=1 Tax=Panagrolaimus superbus TaxID=310955 RepID=A0A914Y6D3_9BILA
MNRIRNGEFTPDDLFQFTVKVHNPVSVCTGSIISKRYVLTAAHCIKEQESSPKIKYDTYEVYQNNINYAEVRPLNIFDKSKMPKSINAYITKNFSQWYSNDIAILEFPEGTDFGIEPVKLAKDYFEKEGDEAYITGFGAWWEEGNKTSGGSTVLRHASVPFVMECLGTLRICDGNSTHHGLQGDSGGPMIIQRNNQWYQIAVASGYSHQDGHKYDLFMAFSFLIFVQKMLNQVLQIQ